MFAKSKSLRVRSDAATSSFHTLAAAVETQEEWRWARPPTALREKAAALEHLKKRNAWWVAFSTQDIAEVKKKFSPSESKNELQHLDQLRSLVGALETEVMTLTAMQAARHKVSCSPR